MNMLDDMRCCSKAINLGWIYKFTAQRFLKQKLILKSFYGHLELQLLLLQNNKHKYALLSQ